MHQSRNISMHIHRSAGCSHHTDLLFCFLGFPSYPGLETRKGKKKKKGEKRKKSKLEVPDTVKTDLPLRSSLPNLHALRLRCFLPFQGGYSQSCLSPSRDRLQQLTSASPAAADPRFASTKVWASGRGCMRPDRALPACLATLSCVPSALLLVGFSSPPFAAYPADGRGAVSHPCQGRQPRWPELTRERNCPQTLWGSCEPHAVPHRHSHTRMQLWWGSTPKQQTPHHSSKPRGLFQTLPCHSPAAVGRVIPSCELSCFVQAGDRPQAAQPSNAAT